MKSIEEVQKIVGLSRRVIQEYEKAGLAEKPDKRNKYGHLLYEEKHIERLWQLRFYKELNYKKSEIKEIFNSDPEDEMVLETAIEELQQKREMIDNLISIANVLKESGMSFNSMRHCFSGVKCQNSDQIFGLMAASARTFDFWNNDDYIGEVSMTEDDEDGILEAIRNILLLRERKILFSDQKVMKQIERMYEIISKAFSGSLVFFRGSLIEYLPGSEMAKWLDKEWGEGTAKYLQDALEYFCRMNEDSNIDQIWIGALDKMGSYNINGNTPDSEDVQNEISKIYKCINESKWLTEKGKKEALRKIGDTINDKAFKDEIDRDSVKGTADFCSQAIKIFCEKHF